MQTEMALVFDEIGYWSEIKLDIVRRYAVEYSKIIKNNKLPCVVHLFLMNQQSSQK